MHLFSSEKGASLIQVLIAVGIIGMVSATISKSLTFTFKANKKSSNNVELHAIKRLGIKADCTLTIPSGTCKAGTLQELQMETRQKKRKLLVSKDPNNPTVLGNWTLKATCNDTEDGVFLQAALQKPGKAFSSARSDFFTDPLSGRISTWKDKSTHVFGENFDVCMLESDFKDEFKKALGGQYDRKVTSAKNGSGDSFSTYRSLGRYDVCMYTGMTVNCKDCPNDSGNNVWYRCELLPPKGTRRDWLVYMSGRNDEGLAKVDCFYQCKNY